MLLGRPNGDTCLVELLPLPSPSIGLWLYPQHSQLPSYLINRKTYMKWCLPSRIKHLRDQITQYKPKAVVFYGLGYCKHWQEIAGINLLQESDKIYIGHNGTTFFVMTKHPVAHGVTNEYFYQVGRLIGASN